MEGKACRREGVEGKAYRREGVDGKACRREGVEERETLIYFQNIYVEGNKKFEYMQIKKNTIGNYSAYVLFLLIIILLYFNQKYTEMKEVNKNFV